MQKINITLTPKNKWYPTLSKTNITNPSAIFEKVYHGDYPDYNLKITSDWYETVNKDVQINKDTTLPVQLKFKPATLTVNAAVKLPTSKVSGLPDEAYSIGTATAVINGTEHNIPGSVETKMNPSSITVSGEKKFFTSTSANVSLTPSSSSKTITLEFTRKVGTWKREQLKTETIKRGETIKEDATKPSDYRQVTKTGRDGVRTYYAEKEYIDGEYTGYSRNSTSSITTTAVNDEVTVGTATVSKIDYVTLKDFGAKGDGVTDDTQALKKAVASNKPIYVTNGTYLIKSTVTLDTNTYIFGESRTGAVLKSANQYILTGVYGYSGVIDTLTFDGYGIDMPCSSMLTNLSFTGHQGIRNVRTTTIENCSFSNLSKSGIETMTDSKLYFNTFNNNAIDVNLLNSNDNQVTKNVMTSSKVGIYLETSSFNSILFNKFSNTVNAIEIRSTDHLDISSNKFVNKGTTNFIALSGGTVRVSNNVFDDSTLAGSAIKVTSLENCLINDNTTQKSSSFVDLSNSYNKNVYRVNNGASVANQTDYFHSDYSTLLNLGQESAKGFANVKDFGAKGDGSTDDTNAFKQAVATGKTVYIPSGKYKITSSIAVEANQTIFGGGPVDNWGTEMFGVDSVRAIIIGSTYPFTNLSGNIVKDIAFRGYGLKNVSNAKIYRCSFSGVQGITNMSNSVVDSTIFLKTNGSAIDAVNNNIIQNNFFFETDIVTNLVDSSGNKILNNKIEWNNNGILVKNSTNDVIAYNTFDRQTVDGITCTSSVDIAIIYNKFERSLQYQLRLAGSGSQVLSNSFFEKSKEDGGVGTMYPAKSIRMVSVSNATISGNIATQAQQFIDYTDSWTDANEIENNVSNGVMT